MWFSDVWLRYSRPGFWGNGPWVLRGVTGSLEPGKGAAVLGHNAAGKSTLLRLAAGLLRADRGTVSERPRRIGYVPERFPAEQPFTGRRYLESIARIRGADPAAITQWAERLHFARLLDIRLSELSKGSAQKVGLIQALLGEPELLILDEPWEGLDAQTRAEVPAIVAEVMAAGGRVLLSDHLGQTDELPGLVHWYMVDGVLSLEPPPLEVEPASSESDPEAAEALPGEVADCVVEVAMRAADVPAAVASLQAAGHRIVRVRGQR